MDLTHKPALLNAKFLIEVLGGEKAFVISGDDTYTTSDGKVLECLILEYDDGESILYSPNATARKAFQEAGLKTSEQAKGMVVVMHTVKVLVGQDEKDGVRIKEIRKSKKGFLG